MSNNMVGFSYADQYGNTFVMTEDKIEQALRSILNQEGLPVCMQQIHFANGDTWCKKAGWQKTTSMDNRIRVLERQLCQLLDERTTPEGTSHENS